MGAVTERNYDAIGVHVTDGSFYEELERIWYRKDMGLLP